MVRSAHHRFAAVIFAAPAALLGACSPPNESPSDAPGTTPSVWTGASAPSSSGEQQPAGEASAESLNTSLKTPDGTEVATATFEFADDYATITVTTTGAGHLSPGFHGLHLHKVGKCEANSVAPTGGEPGDFNSAGGHYQVAGHTGEPASGDLTSLQVRKDGSAVLVTTTDAFTRKDLLAGDGTALIIHGGADNFANIPSERYTQANGAPGPDETTMSTGDAGKRVACGVLGSD
jgi:Cu-Zn family superoxide dismutase